MNTTLKLIVLSAMIIQFSTHATVESKTSQFETSESRLFDYLFGKYDNNVRPVKNKSNPVQVSLDVALVQLVDLPATPYNISVIIGTEELAIIVMNSLQDDKEQNLQTNLWIRQKWINELLKWDPKQHAGIKSLIVDKSFLWTPDIVLYNNAKNGKHAGSIDQFKTRVEINYDGIHKWYIPAILTSSCSIDITYFPFDTQMCPLKFGSWTYLSHELNLTKLKDSADLSAYLPSSSFHLRKAAAIRNVVKYPCCEIPYIDVTFELLLERQPGFYVYNVIIPVLVVTVFALMNFMLPDVTGSRMGLIFDSFLAITVTYMMVGDKMPVSSDSIPIIAKFMLFCMSIMVLTVLTSAVSMRVKNKDKLMPNALRAIVFGLLAPMVCVSQNCCISSETYCKTKKQIPSKRPNRLNERERKRLVARLTDGNEEMKLYGISRDSSSSSGYPETSESSFLGDWDQYFSSGFSSLDSTKMTSKYDEECIKDLNSLLEEQNRKIDDANKRDFWRCVSQIADRLFLIVFLVAWLLMVTVLFLSIPVFNGKKVLK